MYFSVVSASTKIYLVYQSLYNEYSCMHSEPQLISHTMNTSDLKTS